VNYLLDEPRLIAGEERNHFGIRQYSFDPSLAPEGKSVMIMSLISSYDYWQRIYGRTIYDHEQIQEADLLIDVLEEFYPGIKEDIELTDVATPLSYERFTGNWQGSICGWLLTGNTLPYMVFGMGNTLPGLSKFYMTGQWTEPGGSLPIVGMAGRNIIQLLCHEDGKTFVPQIPQ
jgi:phytoene dehydrogenase-like protein